MMCIENYIQPFVVTLTDNRTLARSGFLAKYKENSFWCSARHVFLGIKEALENGLLDMSQGLRILLYYDHIDVYDRKKENQCVGEEQVLGFFPNCESYDGACIKVSSLLFTSDHDRYLDLEFDYENDVKKNLDQTYYVVGAADFHQNSTAQRFAQIGIGHDELSFKEDTGDRLVFQLKRKNGSAMGYSGGIIVSGSGAIMGIQSAQSIGDNPRLLYVEKLDKLIHEIRNYVDKEISGGHLS